MKKLFIPKTSYEKFCAKILFLLVENSEATFICGGTARDIILNKKLNDFDISTDLSPTQVLNILNTNRIEPKKISSFPNFGVTKIQFNSSCSIDISTFRIEQYKQPSYPKISFTQSVKKDSIRRDFTINSLYISPKNGNIFDFYKGLNDLQRKTIKFIGKPNIRITEDPFRMIRALRLSLVLGFKLEKKSWKAIVNLMPNIKFGSKKKIILEINKVKNKKNKKILNDIFIKKISLDKVVNKFYYK